MAVANAPRVPANFRNRFDASASEPLAVNKRFEAVIGDIRPVGTAPNFPGFRTNQASMPKSIPPRNSMSFAQANANTATDSTRGTQRTRGRTISKMIPMPSNEKQSAVLGAIGMYLARTLARIDNPEVQPTNVISPRARASTAHTNGNARPKPVAVLPFIRAQFAETSKRVQH